MSKIRFFALGGLSEYGKNMYVFEIDNNLYILDAGIKYPSQELYGVDEIIPDYRMLIRAKNRIKGIFLSHAHEDHIGALPPIICLDEPTDSINKANTFFSDNSLIFLKFVL